MSLPSWSRECFNAILACNIMTRQCTHLQVQETRVTLIRCPHQSAVRYTLVLRMLLCSLWHICHEELHFHPYKIQNVQQFTYTPKDRISSVTWRNVLPMMVDTCMA
ncbi:hypothetical protein PR048_031797 [Dryococelus australis]|uniref:Uncharacterized protein n=1 Tax=Dryococelus australis TaxID=614101 RepID=A0ABQ9G968_9NEOP|nr:hypothetical protein PR048_031797 [Dryococelus australis]